VVTCADNRGAFSRFSPETLTEPHTKNWSSTYDFGLPFSSATGTSTFTAYAPSSFALVAGTLARIARKPKPGGNGPPELYSSAAPGHLPQSLPPGTAEATPAGIFDSLISPPGP